MSEGRSSGGGWRANVPPVVWAMIAGAAAIGLGTAAWVATRKPPLGCPPTTVVRQFAGPDGGVGWACFSAKGEREGPSLVLDTQGNRLIDQTFEHDLPQGEFSRYDANGVVRERGTYLRGKKSGTWISFDAQGRKRTEQMMRHGEATGRFVSYFPSGEKEEEGQLDRGVRTGTWSRFSAAGLQLDETVWNQGLQVSKSELANTAVPDAGIGEARAVQVPKGLYGGRPIAWWESRLNVLAAESNSAALLNLTEARGRLSGLKISSDASGYHAVPAGPGAP